MVSDGQRVVTDERMQVELFARPSQHTGEYVRMLCDLGRQVDALLVQSRVQVVHGRTEVFTDRLERGTVLVTRPN